MSVKTKSFRKDLQISSKKFGLAALSLQDVNVLPVAKHHNLPGILYRAKAATAHFVQEPLPSHQPVHISQVTAHDATFGHGAGGKQLSDPAIRGDDGGQV
jgi:hypothetical protein